MMEFYATIKTKLRKAMQECGIMSDHKYGQKTPNKSSPYNYLIFVCLWIRIKENMQK